MKKHQGLIGMVVLGSVLAACSVTPLPTAQPVGGMTANGPQVGALGAPGMFDAEGFSKMEIMVALNKGQNANELKAIGQKQGFTVVKYWPQINSAVIRVDRFGSTRNLSGELKKAKSIAHAQPAGQIVLEDVNDPMYGDQYGMKLMNVASAWKVEPGKKSVKIAIIDTGVDIHHPDLKDKIVPGYNANQPGQPPLDENGHGTHCAGIAAAAANNGQGVIGVGGNVSIMPVKVLGAGATEATIADGVIWAADNGAHVATMSLGLYRRSPVFERALQYALDKGVTLTASAGNNNAENDPEKYPHLPSTHPGVIEVAATDSNDQKASFSNFGKTVSVAAPGVNILSTLPGGKYGAKSGTSMAAPHVAGLAGLIISKNPGIKPAQVKRIIEASAKDFGAPGFDPIFGHGRADALAAVQK